MKTTNRVLITLILLNVWSCTNGQSDSKDKAKSAETSLNEIINYFDSKLSAKQRSYRLWLEAEDQMMTGVFDLPSIKNLSTINNNIEHFMSAKDTIRSYGLFFSNVTAEYGSELIIRIKDEDVKEKFNVKWRTYQEGVAEVMNYDLEMTNNILKVLIFLRDNYTKYNIENDLIYFDDDPSLKEYQRLLGEFIDPKTEIAQQNVRSKSMHTFLEAINIAKEVIH